MDLDFWHERWERGETGFHQSTLNPYLVYFYGEKGPAPETRASLRVFVPFCGKSLDMAWLAENGYATVGVECSPIAVREFFDHHNRPHHKVELSNHIKFTTDESTVGRGRLEILQSDFFALNKTEIGEFTDIFDRAALIALPAAMRLKYVTRMAELQGAGTRTLLVTLSYPQHEMDGPPFSVSEQEVHDLYDKDFIIEKLLVKNILKDEPRFQQRGLTALVETAYKLTRK